jgi:hypothetical protein
VGEFHLEAVAIGEPEGATGPLDGAQVFPGDVTGFEPRAHAVTPEGAFLTEEGVAACRIR